jgi:hypothetical protein
MPNYVTINGKRSTHICNTIPGLMPAMMLNADSSSKPSCGSCAAEPNGGCFPRNSANGTASTNALPVGATTKYGKICINILPMTRIWRISCWTAPSYEHIPVPLELQKKWRAGKPSARTQPRWVQHQDPRQRRCSGQSAAVSSDWRAAT